MYVDDIVIWSSNIDKHVENVRKVMKILEEAWLYCNKKQTKLFAFEIDFLGHTISTNGITADNQKVNKILEWPQLHSANEVHAFFGLEHYLLVFLPKLTVQTDVPTPLTSKEADKHFTRWDACHAVAFQEIKYIVFGCDCLTIIDYNVLDDNKIFVTTDASKQCSGAILSFCPTWESAQPVAFDSSTFKGAELNYPVHEKELLAIVCALKKWHSKLFGCPLLIYTDHRLLRTGHPFVPVELPGMPPSVHVQHL